MKEKTYKNISLALTLVTLLYFLLILFLKISLIGFWTDIICATVLIYSNFRALRRINKVFLRNTLFSLNVLYSVILFITTLSTLHRADSFYFIEVDGRLFNAYVQRGFSLPPCSDNLSITETSKCFPFFEKGKFYESKFIDFEVIETDGTGTDKEKIKSLKWYIKNEVIKKNK